LGGVDIRALEVVMDIDEVKAAVCAVADEVRKVLQTGLPAAIGYGWGTELDLAVIGLHVLLVDSDAVGDIEVGLACVVWFVGAVA